MSTANNAGYYYPDLVGELHTPVFANQVQQQQYRDVQRFVVHRRPFQNNVKQGPVNRLMTGTIGMCCGAKCFYGFSGTPEEIEEELKRRSDKSFGFLTLILNDDQDKKYRQAVLNAGYKELMRATNPVHQNETEITLYGREMHPPFKK